MQLDRGVIREPRECGRAVDDQILLTLARVGRNVSPARDPIGRVLRRLLLPEALLVDAVGEAIQIERALEEVRDQGRRDRHVVTDEVTLGDRLFFPAGREQHLVEVRERELASLEGPGSLRAQRVERFDLAAGRCIERCAGGARFAVASPRALGLAAISSLV